MKKSSAFERMKGGDKVEMWEAAKVIVKRADLKVVPKLLELMETSLEVDRRVAAAWTLGFLRSLAALEPLIRILDNRSEAPALRDHAAEALGYLSDLRAREVLVRTLSDGNADVRFSCAFALRTVGKPDDIPQLERLTRDPIVTNSYGASVAQEAREAIEQIRYAAAQDSRPGR